MSDQQRNDIAQACDAWAQGFTRSVPKTETGREFLLPNVTDAKRLTPKLVHAALYPYRDFEECSAEMLECREQFHGRAA